jgi:predicted transposase YbfD/YdcC
LVAIGEWAADLPAGVRERLGLHRGAPSETTIRRSLQRLDPDELDTALRAWLTRGRVVDEDGPRVIAIDGKTCRGARTGHGQVHLLAALDTGDGTVLGQVQVEGKSNKMTAFPLLVKGIDVAGALITADAMHTQREHVSLLHSLGAHWPLIVKDNHPKLRASLAGLPWEQVPVADRTVDADHGRTETRTLQVVQVKSGVDFPHAALALRMTRRRQVKGKAASTEKVLAITDLSWHQIQPRQLADAMRAHWGIENRLHWVRDVTYGEDHSQVRTGTAPAVRAALRNFAISLHRRAGATNIAEALRHTSRHPARTLKFIR